MPSTPTVELKPITYKRASSGALIDLFTRRAKAVRASRSRILLCRDVRRNLLNVNIPDTWLRDPAYRAAADWLEVALPERQTLDRNIGNQLVENEPVYERVPLGTTDTAARDADLLEVFGNSVRERTVPWESIIGKAHEDGEYGAALLPSGASWMATPSYLGKDKRPKPRYDRDGRDRPRDHASYGGRDEKRSRKAYDDELLTYAAEHLPWTARLFPALDCVPILTAGTGRRRFNLKGLVCRTLFDREELLEEKGYRWHGSDKKPSEGVEKALLISRGYDADVAGDGDRIYLYEGFFDEYIEGEDGLPECHPYITYCVAGVDTRSERYESFGTDSDRLPVLDLREEYGPAYSAPTWGYYWGLHAEDDDPDYRGIPFIYPMLSALLNTEGLLTAHLAHTWDYAFSGEYHIPDPRWAQAEGGMEAVMEGHKIRGPEYRPSSGEIMSVTGQVVPAVPNPAGADARYMEQVLMQSVRENSPDPAEAAGEGGSGHAMVVSSSLLKTAVRQIRDGAKDCVEDFGEWMLRIAAALLEQGATVAVHAVTEQTLDGGEERARREAMQLNERWVGENFRFEAVFREESTLADKSLISQEYAEGRASWERYCKAWGIASPETERVMIAGDSLIKTPQFQMRLMAAWLRRRGEAEAADEIELKLAGELTEDGAPTAAMPPEPQEAMPGVGMPDMAASVRGGQVAGEIGQATAIADARALSQIAPNGVTG